MALYVTLADARLALGLATANTTKDADLATYIAAAIPVMEGLVGPITALTCTETYDGGSEQIVLLNAPVISVTSIKESYYGAAQTLTAQDIFAGTGLGALGYSIDLPTGVITRSCAGQSARFAPGRRNVQVIYVAGRSTVPSNILIATRLVIRQLWLVSGQQGLRPAMGSPDGVPALPIGFAVPNAVLELCADEMRPPGLA